MALDFKGITDKAVWEKFILEHQPAALFQSWVWAQVQERLGLRTWKLGLYSGQKILGIALVVKVTARRGTFLHVRHGPVFDKYDNKQWQVFTNYLKSLAFQEKAWFIRFSPQIPQTEGVQMTALGMRPAPIHAMDGEICWVLDLDKSEQDLLGGMRKTTRYEIKAAQKLGVIVTKSVKAADLRDFLGLYKPPPTAKDLYPTRGLKRNLRFLVKPIKQYYLWVNTRANYWPEQLFYFTETRLFIITELHCQVKFLHLI